MSKISKEIVNVLNKTEIIDILVNDEANGWYDDIKVTYDDYSINNPVVYETEVIVNNLNFTVVILYKDGSQYTELYAGDLLDHDTELVVDATFLMKHYMNFRTEPEVEIFASNEESERDNEVIILITL